MLDRGCSMSMSLQLPNKKVTKYVIQEVVEFLNMLCYEEVVLKSDSEPVCKVLLENVRSARSPKKTHIKFAPRYSSQSKGAVENYIRRISGKIRALLLELSVKYGVAITCQHHIFAWVVRHASFMYVRFFVKANGRTAYEELFLERYTSKLCPLGECVLFRAPMSATGRLLQGKRWRKGDPMWHFGRLLRSRSTFQ